jgi:hypothetical protein
MNTDRACLEQLTKEELIDLAIAYAKNAMALDGLWFQAVEAREGMDVAMACDEDAWQRFGRTEGRRIKEVLGLGEHPGLEGLQNALRYKFSSLANEIAFERSESALVFRIVDCRVQSARRRKGMELHPCKSVGFVEYTSFAAEIDARIGCTCLSCYPDMTDTSVCCAWRFALID